MPTPPDDEPGVGTSVEGGAAWALDTGVVARELVTDLAVTAAGIGTYDWDLLTGTLAWDERILALFEYDEGSFDRTLEAFNRRVDPEHLPGVADTLQHAIDTCGSYEMEYRLVLPSGRTRWIAARGRALAGPDGRAVRVLGAAYDTTAQQDDRAYAARVLEAIPTAFFSLDRGWRFTYVNAEAEHVLRRRREEMLGGVVWDLFPAAVGSDFERYYRQAIQTGELATFEAYYPAPLDRWYEVRAWPGTDGLAVYFLDATERIRAQEASARDAAAAARVAGRLELTARVTSELAETLEAPEAVARLARLVVPVLADFCIVTVVDDEADAGGRPRFRDIASWHADPAMRPVLDRYAATRMAAIKDSSFLRRSLTVSQTIVIPQDATRAIREVLHPGEARSLLEQLAPHAGAVMPMRARGRTIGALSLFTSRERGAMSEDDVAHAEDVARRAALALDNVRLYRQQVRLAEGLQRSLLTEPPEPDHLQVVVRYEPAAEAAKVGGDWYDAFLQSDGSTVLVIGDVVGHDLDAAATMGQMRSVLRGIAVTTGDGPAGVLERVDRGLRTLRSEALATVLVARVEQTPEERATGVCRIRWSSAGHPDPLLVRPDGSVDVLKAVRRDLLLGVRPDDVRTETEVVVGRGSTLFLYTDGLVERPDQPLRAGMAVLRATLAELAAESHDLDTLCDEVLRRLVRGARRDDVALVAVRLHPQDRPRPPEAGPNVVPPDVPPDPVL